MQTTSVLLLLLLATVEGALFELHSSDGAFLADIDDNGVIDLNDLGVGASPENTKVAYTGQRNNFKSVEFVLDDLTTHCSKQERPSYLVTSVGLGEHVLTAEFTKRINCLGRRNRNRSITFTLTNSFSVAATPLPATPSPISPAPVTPAPIATPAPVSPAPTTPAPITPQPVTPGPITPHPVTPAPITPQPVTVTPAPVTPQPVTPQPVTVTPAPVTPQPVTPQPVTPSPITPQPVTPQPVTPSPTTPQPVTPQPVTPSPITPQPVTPQPVTPSPITPQPVTPQPVTPSPITPQPVTPSPVTPQPVTPSPVTPQPVTPAPITPQPVTPAPITPQPVIRNPLSDTPAPTPSSIRVCPDDFNGGADAPGFDMCMDLNMPYQDKEVFERARDRWTNVIVGDVYPFSSVNLTHPTNFRFQACNYYPDIIEDLYVCSRLDDSLPWNVIATAGSGWLRDDSKIPITGWISFNPRHLDDLRNDGYLEDIITHEMGHILGIGYLWRYLGLTGASTDCPYYGEHANARFNEITGCSGTAFTETRGGQGTACGHWDECFGNELMTGIFNFEAAILSNMTVGALADIGYTVDYSAADTYDTSDRSTTGYYCTCPSERALRGDFLGGAGPMKRKMLSAEAEAQANACGEQILAEMATDPADAPPGTVYEPFVNVIVRDSDGSLHSRDFS